MKKLFLLLIAVISIGLAASAQTRTVRGTVVDSTTDEPLIGVSVVPAGTTNGVLTDIDGNFTITIKTSVKSLDFSYVGYQKATLPVQDKMNVALKPEAEILGDVVVTGYGSGKKLGSMVGSVSVVGSDALENVTTPSFLDALQGKVAGLSVMSNSGDPSSTQNQVRLRGVNSLNSSVTPLFILDGAPITQSVFSTLNPGDIESITVLKDAASVAIYGSRAANGVIVITSKKGKYSEKATVSIRAKYGWSQMTSDKTEMMNSEQYIRYRDLIGQPVGDDQRAAWEKYGIDTDWRAETFNGHAPTYSLEAAVTGGSESTNYYLSLNHMDMDGIIEQSQMRREAMRVNLSTRATKWLRVGFQGNFGYTKYQQNNESNAIYSGNGVYTANPMVFSRRAMPMDSPYYYTIGEDGQIIWGEKAEYLHYTGMPTPHYFNQDRSVWRNRVTVNAQLFEELTPIEGLTLRAQQAVDASDSRVENYVYAHGPLYSPMGDVYGEDDANESGVIEGYNSQSFGRYYQFTYTNTAEYRFKINNIHNITLLAGEESIVMKETTVGVSSEGQSDRRLPLLQQGLAKSFDGSQSISELAMNSFFLSGSYNYEDKYFVDANFRMDASSRFAPGHRWAEFWSAGVMWDAKQENFLRQLTWLNKARLRVSYGTTGNSSFSNYAYFGLVGSGGNYNNQTSLGVAQAPNTSLSWERVGGLDVGLALGFWNKLDLDIAFYNKNTTDMLVQVPYSMTTGLSANWSNMASMRNTGVDLQVSYTPVQTRDWLFEIHGNMNYNKNQITKLFDGLDELPFPNSSIIYKKGHMANEFYMVRYAGVDPRDGAQQWYTREGNITKVYNESRDAVGINKSQFAPWGGGFGTNVSWKGLSLLADFTWAADKWMVNNDLYFCQNNNFAQDFNQTTKMLEVWTKPGDITDVPAANGQVMQFDTHMLENASFVRLKTLTLQYSLPKVWMKKANLTNVNLHFTGRNLLTFTGYTGYDPEPETNIIAFFYPNTRQYEFGFDVTF